MRIVFLSRLHPQKGIWDFVEMIKELRDFEFTIIGYDELGVAGRIRAKLRVAENVEFYPNATEEQKRKLLGNGHVFVSLSKGYDPTPNVLYEAMGSEMAIISRLKNYRYDILGDDALWIDSWQDATDFLEDVHELRKRAKLLRKKAENLFNTKRMVKEYKVLIESLV